VSDDELEAYQERVTTKLSELIAHERDLIKKEICRPDPYADCFFCEFKPLCPLYPEGQPIFAPKELVR